MWPIAPKEMWDNPLGAVRCHARNYRYSALQQAPLSALSPFSFAACWTLPFTRCIVSSFRISSPFLNNKPVMDPLSATSSIIAILQLSSKVVGYLAVVKDASKERIQCAIEISNLQTLLLNLKFHVEMENVNTPWHTAVRALTIENGPLDQFQQCLETLQSGMTDRGRLKKATDILMWKFKKAEVTSILGRIERLKTLVEIALQRDQM